MLCKRIIPCPDINDGRVVKGVNFVGLRDAGDPVEVVKRYSEQRADGFSAWNGGTCVPSLASFASTGNSGSDSAVLFQQTARWWAVLRRLFAEFYEWIPINCRSGRNQYE